MIHFDRIEAVAVQSEEALSCLRLEDKLVTNVDAQATLSQQTIHLGATQKLIVIAGSVEQLGSPLGEIEQTVDDLRIDRLPTPMKAQLPAVQEVTENEELLRPDLVEVRQKMLGLRVAAAEMHVADDKSPNATLLRFQVNVHEILREVRHALPR